MKIMFDSSIPREETMKMKDGLELGLLNKWFLCFPEQSTGNNWKHSGQCF